MLRNHNNDDDRSYGITREMAIDFVELHQKRQYYGITTEKTIDATEQEQKRLSVLQNYNKKEDQCCGITPKNDARCCGIKVEKIIGVAK